jgi:hypothetical protein
MKTHHFKDVQIGTPDDERVWAWRKIGYRINAETGDVTKIDELVFPGPRKVTVLAAFGSDGGLWVADDETLNAAGVTKL